MTGKLFFLSHLFYLQKLGNGIPLYIYIHRYILFFSFDKKFILCHVSIQEACQSANLYIGTRIDIGTNSLLFFSVLLKWSINTVAYSKLYYLIENQVLGLLIYRYE